MNKLETEIIDNLKKSKFPLEIETLLRMSKITIHSRRLNASVLKLENEEVLFLVKDKKISRHDNRYGLVGYHHYE